jgi:glucose/arabinose dehydrogenase
MPKSKFFRLLAAIAMGVSLLMVLLVSARAASASAALKVSDVVAVEYASGAVAPVDIANTGVQSDTRLFIVERAGRIVIVQEDSDEVSPTAFLSITTSVIDGGGEQGLLGLAFSPNYDEDKHFFVYYVNNGGDLQLSRFSVSLDPDVALTTETKLLTIPHPIQTNHNGGDLAFGPDGFLYLAPGDGGGGGDTDNSAQTLDNLLGKVLRLNVMGVPTYTSPITNPYATVIGLDEIWAIGLRNPFRFSFDRATGDLYIGDVGQGAWEEINFLAAGSPGGANFGWRCYEGNHTFNTSGCGQASNYVMPVAEYCNASVSGCVLGGRAVIGGYVYRGSAYPGLQGYYVYADSISSRFWVMQPGTWQTTVLNIDGGDVPNPGSFGEDVNGELYVAALGNGRIYRIEGNLAPIIETPWYLPLMRR